jgi:hypothetical protein
MYKKRKVAAKKHRKNQKRLKRKTKEMLAKKGQRPPA